MYHKKDKQLLHTTHSHDTKTVATQLHTGRAGTYLLPH